MAAETVNKPCLLTITQAAELIDGLTVYGLEQLCKAGQMPYIRFGSKKLIDQTVLIETITKLARETPNTPERKTRKDKGIPQSNRIINGALG